jgi:hypothetical protein
MINPDVFYDRIDMRGSGIFSTDDEVTIDQCDECGTFDGTRYVDDWGNVTVECVEGHRQPEPDPMDYEPDFDYSVEYDEGGYDW